MTKKKFFIYIFPIMFTLIKIFNFFKYAQCFDNLNFKIAPKLKITDPSVQNKLAEAYLYVRSSFDSNRLTYILTLIFQALVFIFIARLIQYINKKPVIRAKITATLSYVLGIACGFLLFWDACNLIPSPVIPFADFYMLIPFFNILSSWTLLKLLNVYSFIGILGFAIEFYTI